LYKPYLGIEDYVKILTFKNGARFDTNFLFRGYASMNFKDFKAGRWVQQYEYQSFSPAPVNHAWSWEDPRINTLLEQAIQAIGELNAFSLIVPDVDLFIQMHVVKEASTSSRIEGTQTEVDEALKPKEMVAPERRDDWQEV